MMIIYYYIYINLHIFTKNLALISLVKLQYWYSKITLTTITLVQQKKQYKRKWRILFRIHHRYRHEPSRTPLTTVVLQNIVSYAINTYTLGLYRNFDHSVRHDSSLYIVIIVIITIISYNTTSYNSYDNKCK